MSAGSFTECVVYEIRRLRVDKSWSQTDLADRTQGAVSKAALASYELGHTRLPLSVLREVAQALGTTAGAIVAAAETAAANPAEPAAPALSALRVTALQRHLRLRSESTAGPTQ